jgi:hypothetical protein
MSSRGRIARVTAWLVRCAGVLLCLAVVVIHVMDQGGFPGSKMPTYVGIGYYLIEMFGTVAAVLFIGNEMRTGWFLAIGVAAGPLGGFILSRGPGLPGYADDKGNWTEPLGLISMAVEGLLLVLGVIQFARSRAHAPVAERSAYRLPA